MWVKKSQNRYRWFFSLIKSLKNTRKCYSMFSWHIIWGPYPLLKSEWLLRKTTFLILPKLINNMSNLGKLLKTFHSRKRKQSKVTTHDGALSKHVTPFSGLRHIFSIIRLAVCLLLVCRAFWWDFSQAACQSGPHWEHRKIVSNRSLTTHPWLQKKKKQWKRVAEFSMLAIQLQLLESRLLHSPLQTCKPWPNPLSSPCKTERERAGSSSLITLQTSARGQLWNDQTPMKPTTEARMLA